MYLNEAPKAAGRNHFGPKVAAATTLLQLNIDEAGFAARQSDRQQQRWKKLPFPVFPAAGPTNPPPIRLNRWQGGGRREYNSGQPTEPKNNQKNPRRELVPVACGFTYLELPFGVEDSSGATGWITTQRENASERTSVVMYERERERRMLWGCRIGGLPQIGLGLWAEVVGAEVASTGES